ncbi:MAG: alpha/beta fold hydrolase [Candidatus Eisenbacteria bacterium]
MLRIALCLSGWLCLLTPVASSAAMPAEVTISRGAFLLRSATDTISVERFERSATRIRGELLFRLADQRWTYTLELDPWDGHVTHMQSEFRLATAGVDAPPLQSGSLEFIGDSVFASAGTGVTERIATRRGATPFVNPSFVMQELLARLALAQGPDTHTSAFALSGASTFDVHVMRVGADSVVLAVGNVAMRVRVNAAGDILGGVIPTQGLTLTRLADTDDSLFTSAGPDYSAPAGAPYTATEVRVPTRGGFSLAGTLTLPMRADGRVPCVITVSGSGPQERDERIAGVKGYRIFQQIADELGRRGIAVLRLDDRGVGASGGRFKGATSLDFVADVNDAIAWLRREARIDGARLALLGHSEGGLIAPMVAEHDAQLRGIVLMAGPAYTGRRIIQYQNGAAVDRGRPASPAARDSLLRLAMADVDSIAKVDPWLRYFLEHDPLTVAARVRTPALVMQGGTDRQVTAEQAELLAKALRSGGNKAVELRRFAALDHLFLKDASGDPLGYARLTDVMVPAEVLRTLANWLQARLTGARPGY